MVHVASAVSLIIVSVPRSAGNDKRLGTYWRKSQACQQPLQELATVEPSIQHNEKCQDGVTKPAPAPKVVISP